MKLSSRTLIIGGTALVLATGATVAVAQIPSQTGVISGCYVASSGALRIVDEGVACNTKKGETLLTWNQKGQPGTPGQPGKDGAAGTAGKDGTNGAAGKDGAALTGASLYVAPSDNGRYYSETAWQVTSMCNEGDEVLGADEWHTYAPLSFTQIKRASLNGRRGMVMNLILPSPTTNNLPAGQIYALCLDSTP